MSLRFGWIEVHAVDHCNNNCRWCNNSSPFFCECNHEPEEFFPWLDILEKNNIRYNHISIMGGEPFLHPDLEGFMRAFKKRYNKPLMLTTNAFWLSEEAIKAYQSVWQLTKLLFVSYYPNLLKSIGGEQQADRLIELLRSSYPHLAVDVRKQHIFTELEYSRRALDVEFYCGMSECTVLRPDGVLSRCGFGGFSYQNPYAIPELTESADMFFDLNQPFKPGRFWHWRKRWPLDACAHCTGVLHKKVSWKIEKGTRRNREIELRANLQTAHALQETGDSVAAMALIRRQRQVLPGSEKALAAVFETGGFPRLDQNPAPPPEHAMAPEGMLQRNQQETDPPHQASGVSPKAPTGSDRAARQRVSPCK